MTDWACPLNLIVAEQDANGQFVIHEEPCGTTLHLTWVLSWPLDADSPEDLLVDRETIAQLAYTDSWEVVCENGHTVATSSSAMDDAEPFAMDAVMRAVGAKRTVS